MVKYIWAGLIMIGAVVGVLSGRVEAVSQGMISGAKSAAELAISMIWVYALWMGIMKIAEQSGVVETIAKKTKKIILLLFKGVQKNAEAISFITLNLVANMFGMGNAATPFGLKAMQAMQMQNKEKKRATDDMCLFLILNTASVQILPLSIMAIRAAAGSENPAEIVITSFLATLITAVFGTVCAKLCARKKR